MPLKKGKFKYAVLVADGMADYPLQELEGKTPIEAAHTPAMDFLAREGILGTAKTIPDKMAAGSDVANMSIMGYNPAEFYVGRGPLEAANLGVEMKDGDVAFRCNLITASGDILEDYSAGHISSKEAEQLIKFIDRNLGGGNFKFYPGVSYRHLMLASGGVSLGLHETDCRPPHDIAGGEISRNLPKGPGAQNLIKLMTDSRGLLEGHEINQVRIDLKENPGNMIWLWGQGRKPRMPRFSDIFGINGSVISAVDLLKGLGRIIGLDVIDVPGATGYYDTNYEGKAEAGVESLEKHDFVFVHVEAPDEAGHNGDLRQKITAIERFDHAVVRRFLDAAKKDPGLRILVMPDHPTPVALRSHAADPVCFGMYGAGIAAGGASAYSEKEAQKSGLNFEKGYELMKYFINYGI